MTIAVLCEASKKTHFSVLVTEGRSHNAGYVDCCWHVGFSHQYTFSAETARRLANFGIPITIIQDSAVGYYMENVDMVIVGAEGVVENGGIINSVRTPLRHSFSVKVLNALVDWIIWYRCYRTSVEETSLRCCRIVQICSIVPIESERRTANTHKDGSKRTRETWI